jgi:hypothetical protein
MTVRRIELNLMLDPILALCSPNALPDALKASFPSLVLNSSSCSDLNQRWNQSDDDEQQVCEQFYK